MPSEIMCIHAKHSNYQLLLSSCQENYATTKSVFFLTYLFIVETAYPLVINSLGIHSPPSFIHQNRNDLNHSLTIHSFISFSSFNKHYCMPTLDTKHCWALVIQKSER